MFAIQSNMGIDISIHMINTHIYTHIYIYINEMNVISLLIHMGGLMKQYNVLLCVEDKTGRN